MAHPWIPIDRAETPDGVLELTERDGEFLLRLGGRVLMNSRASRSERALAELALEALGSRGPVRMLIGGLGMGLTLRAALDLLGPGAQVTVSELHEAIARWCRGPLAAVHGDALADPRVTLEIGDVSDAIRRAGAEGAPRLDAILLDLYEGPAPSGGDADPLYGRSAVAATRAALAPGGVLAVWGEAPSRAYARRLRAAGFEVENKRPGRGGLRHAVTLAVAGSQRRRRRP